MIRFSKRSFKIIAGVYSCIYGIGISRFKVFVEGF